MKKVYAVECPLGVMLVMATSEQSALKIAKRLQGTNNGPYRLAKDQNDSIVWAKSFNAFIHE